MAEPASDGIKLPEVNGTDLNEWLNISSWHIWVGGALIAALILFWVARKIARAIRRSRPATYHAKMQPYAEGAAALDEGLAAKRRIEAAKIVATSSSAAIAGYEIVEQVEAVFVEGFRRSEEAIEGLKAAAAMKGANAVTNVHPERNAAGKCSAAGDAVIVRKIGPSVTPSSSAPITPSNPIKDDVP